jgi:hypothetical protein
MVRPVLKSDLEKESLEDQYELVKNETTSSHVEEFGDLTIASLDVAAFLGDQEADSVTYPDVPVRPHCPRTCISYKAAHIGTIVLVER